MKEVFKALGAGLLFLACIIILISMYIGLPIWGVYHLATTDYSHVSTEQLALPVLGFLCVSLLVINHDLKRKLKEEQEKSDRLIRHFELKGGRYD